MAELKSGLEPTTRQFLEFVNNSGQPKITEMRVEDARQAVSMVQGFGVCTGPPADIEERMIPGQASGAIPIRILRPKGAEQKLPVVMYFHGGGWVIGAKEDFDRVVREIAIGAEAAVIYVDYALSPEARFPVALEQCYAATKYVAENGDALNVDPARIALAGDSAGGNFAAVISQLAKERGGPAIALQVLINPATDATSDTGSILEFADGYFLTVDAMTWFRGHYLADPAAVSDAKVSPLLASPDKLEGLPPALVITSEFDVLRDQGEAYARKLGEAGVPVTAVRYLGAIHWFTIFNALANTPPTRSAMSMIHSHLRSAFSGKSKPRSTTA
jgi:acetyl esterase/lipase